MLRKKTAPVRHSRESGNLPKTGTKIKQGIPACAGMTAQKNLSRPKKSLHYDGFK